MCIALFAFTFFHFHLCIPYFNLPIVFLINVIVASVVIC